MSAVEIRDHLERLYVERHAAEHQGLGDCGAYMDDLRDEIVECHTLFVAAAVTEIAILRSELSGRQVG